MKRAPVLLTAGALLGSAVVGVAGVAGLVHLQSRALRRALAADSAVGAPVFTALSRPGTCHGSDLQLVPDRQPTGAELIRPDEDSAALAVLGDSWLAGIGITPPADTPAGLIAKGLARLLGLPVRVASVARPAANSEDLPAQVDTVLRSAWLRRNHQCPGGNRKRFAIISIGAADILDPLASSLSLPVLTQSIIKLQSRGGFTVFILVCPNLGHLPGMRRPLRTHLRRASRVLAGSQWLAALAAHAVPLTATEALAGSSERDLLGTGGRHPSPFGYTQLAAWIVAAIAQRLDIPAAVTVTLPDTSQVDAEWAQHSSDAAQGASGAGQASIASPPHSGPKGTSR